MRYLKVLGLAAVAALGLMAFGVGSASATTLCTDEACTVHYLAGTEIHLSLVGSTRFTSGGSTIETCTASTIKSATVNDSGTTVSAYNSAMTWGASSTACSVTMDTIALGSIEIEKTGANEGKFIGKGWEVTSSVFGTTCTFGPGTGTVLSTFKGGVEPVIVINSSVSKTAGNFLCPSTTGWDAEYVVTSPHALFIGS